MECTCASDGGFQLSDVRLLESVVSIFKLTDLVLERDIFHLQRSDFLLSGGGLVIGSRTLAGRSIDLVLSGGLLIGSATLADRSIDLVLAGAFADFGECAVYDGII